MRGRLRVKGCSHRLARGGALADGTLTNIYKRCPAARLGQPPRVRSAVLRGGGSREELGVREIEVGKVIAQIRRRAPHACRTARAALTHSASRGVHSGPPLCTPQARRGGTRARGGARAHTARGLVVWVGGGVLAERVRRHHHQRGVPLHVRLKVGRVEPARGDAALHAALHQSLYNRPAAPRGAGRGAHRSSREGTKTASSV